MKRGNIESASLKLLMIGAGIVLTCIVISIGMVNLRQSKAMANSTAIKISDFNTELIQSDIMSYDGLNVKGSDVINFYKKYFGDIKAGEESPFTLTIITISGSNAYKDGTSLALMKDGENDYYVKPTSKFRGMVTSNENGIITEVNFKQY